MAVRGAHYKLLAWQEAMSLAEVVYQTSQGFPKNEMFGLTAQMRRAAVSIPSNIAEGAARNSSRELFQFLGIAGGSLAELETQLELAVRLNYIDSGNVVLHQVNRVAQLLVALRKSIRSRIEGPR
jgi:four helix bundle protein